MSYGSYSYAPFYRITHTSASYHAFFYHMFGISVYVCLHMLSSVLIYISTENAQFASIVGILWLLVSILRDTKECQGRYVIDLEFGNSNSESKPESKLAT